MLKHALNTDFPGLGRMIQAFIGAVRFRGQAAGRQDLNFILQPSSIIQDAGWLLSDYGLQRMSISNMALNNLPELLSYLLLIDHCQFFLSV